MPIRNVFEAKRFIDKQVLPEESASFQERIRRIKKKTDAIIENARMVAIAQNLLDEQGGIEVVGKMSEKELEPLVDPYDPAVIVALCQTLEEKKRLARKTMN